MDGYEVSLRYSPQDGYYIAGIVEFIGCVTDGSTAEEALTNLRDVKNEWIEAMHKQGHPIPPPRAGQPPTKSPERTAVAA